MRFTAAAPRTIIAGMSMPADRRCRLASPIGPLTLRLRGDVLLGLAFDDDAPVGDGDAGPVGARLTAYLAGDLAALDRIEVAPAGTPFQQRVWAELRRIPAGTTIAYGDLAARLGDRLAVRAVAAGSGANPIAIVIPCHRVLAADGSLHGYGGGLPRKRWLLVHEGALLA